MESAAATSRRRISFPAIDLGLRRLSLRNEPSQEEDDFQLPPQSDYRRRMSEMSMDVFYIEKDQLNAGIYTDDELGRPQNSSSPMGKMSFSLIFSPQSDELLVNVHSVSHLQSRGITCTPSPFVKVRLSPENQQKFSTKTKRHTNQAEFEETFKFNVSPTDVDSKEVHFAVYDSSRLAKPVRLGSCVFPLKQAGLLRRPTTTEIWMDLCAEKEESVRSGDVFVALSYNPSKGILSVKVLRAKSLSLEANGKDADLFIKASLIHKGKACKNKRGKTVRRETDPVFEEEFYFQVSQSLLDDLAVVVSIWEKHLLGMNQLMGKAMMGPDKYVTGPGLNHWSDMLSSPKSAVAQWHPLT